MISRDYTQEVGIPSHKKTLPRPVAYLVLAIAAAGMTVGVAGVIAATKDFHAAEKAAAGSGSSSAAATTAPVPAPTDAPAAAAPAEATPAK